MLEYSNNTISNEEIDLNRQLFKDQKQCIMPDTIFNHVNEKVQFRTHHGKRKHISESLISQRIYVTHDNIEIVEDPDDHYNRIDKPTVVAELTECANKGYMKLKVDYNNDSAKTSQSSAASIERHKNNPDRGMTSHSFNSSLNNSPNGTLNFPSSGTYNDDTSLNGTLRRENFLNGNLNKDNAGSSSERGSISPSEESDREKALRLARLLGNEEVEIEVVLRQKDSAALKSAAAKYDASSSVVKPGDEECEYDYSRITNLRTPQPLVIPQTFSQKLPLNWIREVKEKNLRRVEDDEEEEEDDKPCTEADLYIFHYFLDSKVFMDHFKNHVFPSTLWADLGFSKSVLASAQTITGNNPSNSNTNIIMNITIIII